MVKDVVGYRFSPTGEELINHYLKNKNLGKPWLVDEAINEINICSYEPIYLPSLARIQSDDLIWYFFAPKEYTTAKKTVTKRTTSAGFWKPTGKDRMIRDKKGKGVQIGSKKTLVYHEGKVPYENRTPWVMHEYHITCLPLHQRNYVICQVMYKGEIGDLSYVNNESEPSQSLVSDSSTVRGINTLPEFAQPGQENSSGLSVDELKSPMNEKEDLSLWDAFHPNMFYSDNINPPVQPQAPHLTPNDDEFLGGLRYVDRGRVEYLFANEEFISRPTRSLQQNCNDYMPKKPLSGIIVDYSTDSSTSDAAESMSGMSYQEASSPVDSVGSSNRHFPSCSSTDSCKDLQTSADPSISKETLKYQLARHTVSLKQEVKPDTPRAVDASMDKKSFMVKPEKKGLFIAEEAMERYRKNPRYIYLMNSLIGFILLLALIGNLIYFFVKT